MKRTQQRTEWLTSGMILSLCLAIALPATGLLCGQTAAQTRPAQRVEAKGPIADLPASSHDFGVIKSSGLTYEHDFLVFNTGSDVLEIREVVVG